MEWSKFPHLPKPFCSFIFPVTVEFYLIKRRILGETDPPTAYYTEEEIEFIDTDFAACINYNYFFNNTHESFLNCSHMTGPSPSVADIEVNGSTVKLDLVDSAAVHFDISRGIYTCECRFSVKTKWPDHKVMVSLMCIQSWSKKGILGCVISPLRPQAESRNLGHTLLANSVCHVKDKL